MTKTRTDKLKHELEELKDAFKIVRDTNTNLRKQVEHLTEVAKEGASAFFVFTETIHILSGATLKLKPEEAQSNESS